MTNQPPQSRIVLVTNTIKKLRSLNNEIATNTDPLSRRLKIIQRPPYIGGTHSVTNISPNLPYYLIYLLTSLQT